jgi:hypothetical protein
MVSSAHKTGNATLELGQELLLREVLSASPCRLRESGRRVRLIEHGPELSRQTLDVPGLV